MRRTDDWTATNAEGVLLSRDAGRRTRAPLLAVAPVRHDDVYLFLRLDLVAGPFGEQFFRATSDIWGPVSVQKCAPAALWRATKAALSLAIGQLDRWFAEAQNRHHRMERWR